MGTPLKLANQSDRKTLSGQLLEECEPISSIGMGVAGMLVSWKLNPSPGRTPASERLDRSPYLIGISPIR